MRTLCFGSFATVLKLCKLNSVTQKRLVGVILLSVNDQYDISIEDDTVHKLIKCDRNLSDNVTAKALTADSKNVADYFKRHVVPLIDPNKRKLVILALGDIIAEDDTIDDTTVVDKVDNLTKHKVISATEFAFADFLAGVFLYTVTTVTNTDGKDSIGEITAEYIYSFEDKKDTITISERLPNFNLEISQELEPDLLRLETSLSPLASHNRPLLVTLLSEANGSCIKCGKNLGAPNNGQPVDYGDIVYLLSDKSEKKSYENAVVLCKTCIAKLPTITPEKKNGLLETKHRLAQNAAILDIATKIPIEKQVEVVLREIAQIDNPRELIPLKMDPVAVDKKITEYPLNIITKSFVTHYFYIVRDILARLEQEGKMDSSLFSSEIKLRYQAVSKYASSQAAVNAVLVDSLYNGIGQKYKSACEIIIAYFVARCEVFDEITQ